MATRVMDVIVIGCGAAGVAALRQLHKAGLDVLGLEADDRIGGRIKTVEFGDRCIDMGAAWCHGEKDNVVFELANPLDLLGRPQPDNKYYVLSNGELLPNEASESILQSLNDVVANADKNTKKSILECVRDAPKTDPKLKRDPILVQSFIEWFERNSHVGGQSDPSKGKSLKGLEENWGCEGEFMLNWKGRGFKTILDVLLNKYPDPSKQLPISIHLNKEVESIKWRSSKQEAGNPLVQITCKDGSLYAAKSVIVTMSIGVLKERYTQLFSPALPAEKINSINTLQFCVVDKIYIEFTEPWWPKTPANFSILWKKEDKLKFSQQEQWVTDLYGLYSVDYHPNVLLAWVYGEAAECMEKKSDAEVKAGVSKLFDIVLKKKFNVSPIKSILRSQWASNPLARGSYSYRSVATEQNGGSAVILSQPLSHGDFPVVCFAGEGTSHHRHSAVHGAIESGFREASRLIEHFKKGK